MCPVCVRRRPHEQHIVYSKEELVQHLYAVHNRNDRPEQEMRQSEMGMEEVVPLADDFIQSWEGESEEATDPDLSESLPPESAHVLFGAEEDSDSGESESEDEQAGPASEIDDDAESLELVPGAAALQTRLGEATDYGVHATIVGVDRAVGLFRFALLLLGQQVTESLLEGFDESTLELHGHSLFQTLPEQVVIPNSVRRIRSKCRTLLGPVLAPQSTRATQGEAMAHVAFLEPKDIVLSWLSLPEVFSALLESNREHGGTFLTGVNPVAAGHASGQHLTISETWHGTEYFDSVFRARGFWEPNVIPGEPLLAVHLGLFYDSFEAKGKESHSILILSLMGVKKSLADRLDLHMPLALLDGDKQVDPLDHLMKRLQPRMEDLARGFRFVARSGQAYRVFCVTSHVYGDIPAIRKIAGLKGAQCLFPCPYCLVGADYSRDRQGCTFHCLSRAVLAAGESGAYPAKTAEMYAEAFAAPFAPQSRNEMAIAYDVRSGGCPPYSGAERALRHFPGVELPNSLCMDLMHNEFLGECRRHLMLLVAKISIVMGVTERELTRRISLHFGEIQKLNRSHVKYKFIDSSSYFYLTAASMKKLVTWSFPILRLAQVPHDHPELRNHLAVWKLRVVAVRLLSKRSLTPEDMRQLGEIAERLGRECCTLYLGFCAIKSHLLIHVVEVARRLGPFPHYWSFRCESKIGDLKAMYANTNGQSVVETVFGRTCLVSGIRRCLEYVGLRPYRRYHPQMSLGEYGSFPTKSFAIKGGGVSFRDVKTILKVFVEDGREMVQVASAPLLVLQDAPLLLVRISSLQGMEDLPISDLLPIDLVPLKDDLCQVLGHDVYGLRPEPVHFVQFAQPALA